MISIIKLSSGETVLADVLSYDEETFNIEVLNPLQLSVTEDLDSRKIQMYTSSWIPLFGEKTTIEIRYDHIIAATEASKDMVDYYKSSLEEMTMKEENVDVDLHEEIRGKVVNEILKIANTSIH